MDDEKLKSMAKQRAEFKQHLMVYVVVMCGLTAINAITSRVYWWVVWPALGWGIGIAFHGLTVYGRIGDSLEEREYQRLKRRHGEDPSESRDENR